MQSSIRMPCFARSTSCLNIGGRGAAALAAASAVVAAVPRVLVEPVRVLRALLLRARLGLIRRPVPASVVPLPVLPLRAQRLAVADSRSAVLVLLRSPRWSSPVVMSRSASAATVPRSRPAPRQ